MFQTHLSGWDFTFADVSLLEKHIVGEIILSLWHLEMVIRFRLKITVLDWQPCAWKDRLRFLYQNF